jgi:peroxiredoxin
MPPDPAKEMKMTIEAGQTLPDVKLVKATESEREPVQTGDYFKGKTVALFSVPGAFTPTCSAKHLPGFVEKAAELKAKGVDEIVCTAVNDAFVMGVWGKGSEGITFLADGSGDFARALGLELDLTGAGLGVRGQRYAMIVKDGVVDKLFVEAPGEFKVSSAEHVLENL